MENSSRGQFPLDQSEFVLTVDLFRILFITFGLISNTILFILLVKYSLLSTHANLFLLNLALTDVISLLYDLFIIVSRRISPSFLESLPCFVEGFGLMLPTINITQIVFIAIERCLFICSPLYYNDIMYKWKSTLTSISWCIPISIFLPLVNILYCQKIYATVFISIFASYLMLSATMVAVLFCAVFKSAREQLHELDNRPRKVSSRRNSQRHVNANGRQTTGRPASTRRRYATLGYDLKLLKGYLVIVGSTFAAYSLPISVFYAHLIGHPDLQLLMKIQIISGALATLNNSINPFVYFYSQRPMQKTFLKLLHRGSLRQRKRKAVRQIAEDLRLGRTGTSVKYQDTHKIIQNGNDPTVPVYSVPVEPVEIISEKKESDFYKDDEYDFAIIDEDID